MTEVPLGFLLVDAARLYRARLDRAFEQAGLGLTAGEARTLAHVSINPGLRQGVLAERMNIEPMTMVGYLDRLESQRLIARDPDATDRRAKIVRLTEMAAPLLEKVLAVATAAREEALAGLAPDQHDALRTALEQVRANLSPPSRSPEA